LQAEASTSTKNALTTLNDFAAAKVNLLQVNQHSACTSPPLTAASQQLVMSLSDEFRMSKIMKVQKETVDASQQEILAALQATGWDTNQAAKQITKDRQVKLENLMRYVFFYKSIYFHENICAGNRKHIECLNNFRIQYIKITQKVYKHLFYLFLLLKLQT